MTTTLTRDELVEEVEHLLRGGIPAREIATRLGRKVKSLQWAMAQEGRPELARPFYEELQWMKRSAARAREPQPDESADDDG